MSQVEGIITNKIRFYAMREKLLTDLTYLARFYKPRIVEFGSGEKIYAKILECFEYNVYTTDIDPKFNPDKIIDIRKDLGFFENERHEYIIAHHVLEHIEQTKALDVLTEFHRILRINGVLSLAIPHRRYWFSLALRIPRVIDRELNIFLDRRLKPDKNHRWELDNKRLKGLLGILKSDFRTVNLIHDDLEAFIICIK